jgi:hypothetical protein
MQNAASEAKARVLDEIYTFRDLDPEFEISGQNTMFPVLTVTSTEAIVGEIKALLHRLPDVKSISPAPQIGLAKHGK